MKIAIVHDWLTASGGAEKLLAEMLHCYPEADIFTVADFMQEPARQFLSGKKVRTTFIQHLPFARKHYRAFLPLMPFAIEQIDLSGYDIVLSSSHAVAKGVLTGPDQLHISYVHSPMRYAWDLQHQYFSLSGLKGPKSWLARYFLHRLRLWDQTSATRADYILANSGYIAKRIRKAWGREATVLHSPVDVSAFVMNREKEDFYLAASRFVPYKRIDLILESFSHMPEKKLIVVGTGPDEKKIRAKAADFPNIRLTGFLPATKLADLLARAKAFVFAAEEDFGLLPLEAQASGTPVIAYGRGGALETVRGIDQPDPTGIFFSAQTTDALCAAVRQFENEVHHFTEAAFKKQLAKFSPVTFRENLKHFIESKLKAG